MYFCGLYFYNKYIFGLSSAYQLHELSIKRISTIKCIKVDIGIISSYKYVSVVYQMYIRCIKFVKCSSSVFSVSSALRGLSLCFCIFAK